MARSFDEQRYRKTYSSNRSEPQMRIEASGPATEFVFPNDLTVSLQFGRNFGRYLDGDIIPAAGKTPSEVIQMAIVEPFDPTVAVTSSTVVEFNQTSINNILDLSYAINTPGATVASATLQWRRNGTGSWITLSTDTGATTYTHTLTDSNFNTQPFNYLYTVYDSDGGVKQSSVDITPEAYVYSAASITASANNFAGITGESDTTREIGNIASTISGEITKTNSHVALTSYSVQYSSDGFNWFYIPGLTAVAVTTDPPTVSLPLTSHDDPSLNSASTLRYRVYVTDTYTSAFAAATIIEFYNVIFYGPSAAAPTNSATVRSATTKVFTTSANTFTLNTGTAYNIFSVAVPTPSTLVSVVDLDALNANITSAYTISSVNVENGAGTPTAYSVYTMTAGIPYSSSHRHQITRT